MGHYVGTCIRCHSSFLGLHKGFLPGPSTAQQSFLRVDLFNMRNGYIDVEVCAWAGLFANLFGSSG